MFDLRDDKHTKVLKDTPIDRLRIDAPEEDIEPEHELDRDEAVERHKRLMSYYTQELDRQEENRRQQAKDEDYYDSIQWTETDAATLRDRGQAPLVYNVISQSVNWVIGSEKRNRTDYKILPRGKEDAKAADIKTKFMKYLSDVNRSPFHRSRAFEDAVKVGIGWLETAAQDEDDGEPIYDRYESWRNILWDSAATESDLSDARYIFRSKWVDVDVAKAMYPDRVDIIEQAQASEVYFGGFDSEAGDEVMDQAEEIRGDVGARGSVITNMRRRVRLIEAWYRMPEMVQRLRGGTFSGEVYDESDPRHVQSAQIEGAAVVEKTMMRTRIGVMTTAGFIFDGPSPYRHNKFKFVPIWGYRRGRDGLPYGIIRGLTDIQDDINKKASKAAFILSTNKVIMDEGAVSDIDAFREEVSRPDAIIVKKPGKDLVLNAERDLASAHLDLMSRGIAMIQQVGGVTDEAMGRTTNAVSGVAIQARQEQGSITTNKLFDNLRLAIQLHGEIQLSLIEQFVTEEKQFRITNERGTPDFVRINNGLPENDITRTKADFIVSEQAWNASIRQSAVQQLSEMIATMPPQVGMVLLDLVVETMDLPNRDELVKRIRSINGQRDPDAGDELSPEEQQQMAAAAEAAAAQKADFEATLRGKIAKALKDETDAAHRRSQIVGNSVDATSKAMEAAETVLLKPTISRVADEILREAGWEQAHPRPLPPMPPQQQLPPPEQPEPQAGMPEQPVQPPPIQ